LQPLRNFAFAAHFERPASAKPPLLFRQADQKIVYLRNWEDEKRRLAGVAQLLRALVKIARAETPDAGAALPPPTPSLVKTQVARRA
jgi:hypothetical protein